MVADRFNDVVGALDYPMAVVTTAVGSERSGCLVGFHGQCSIEPPRYLVFLSVKNHTHRVANGATHLAVHLLDEADREVAAWFGQETGDTVDKFARCEWEPGPEGMPVLIGCRAWFVAAVVGRVDPAGGDHEGFVLDPVAAALRGPLRPLGFQAVKDLDPGHDP